MRIRAGMESELVSKADQSVLGGFGYVEGKYEYRIAI